jgi:hypothetical protein
MTNVHLNVTATPNPENQAEPSEYLSKVAFLTRNPHRLHFLKPLISHGPIVKA